MTLPMHWRAPVWLNGSRPPPVPDDEPQAQAPTHGRPSERQAAVLARLASVVVDLPGHDDPLRQMPTDLGGGDRRVRTGGLVMRLPTWSPTLRQRAELDTLAARSIFMSPLEQMLWRAFHVDHDTFAWRI